jgi:hypothetical protein
VLFGFVTKGLDGGQGGIGFKQGVVDTPSEVLGCPLYGRDVDVIRCRTQGVGDGCVGAGEQFSMVGHVDLLGW